MTQGKIREKNLQSGERNTTKLKVAVSFDE